MAPDPETIYIVETNPVVVQGLREFLKGSRALEIVGTHTIADEAWPAILKTKPDLVITGIDVPATDGIELTEKITASLPRSKTVIFTAFRQPQLIFRAMEAGASAYILMKIGKVDLHRSLRKVLQGEMIIDHAVIGNIAEALGNSNAIIPRLTEREAAVLHYMAEGDSTKGIGKKLSLSPDTIKHHIRHIYEKLGVSTQAAAIARAFRLGFIE